MQNNVHSNSHKHEAHEHNVQYHETHSNAH